MGWLGTFPADRRSAPESGTRPRARLVVGRNLLLWNVLVADVSNDPLRPYPFSIGISSFAFAHCFGRAVSSPLQLAAVSAGPSIGSWYSPGGATTMGYMRMGPLRGNWPIVECLGLFAGISPSADSIRKMGRCLRREFLCSDSQYGSRVCFAQPHSETTSTLSVPFSGPAFGNFRGSFLYSKLRITSWRTRLHSSSGST